MKILLSAACLLLLALASCKKDCAVEPPTKCACDTTRTDTCCVDLKRGLMAYYPFTGNANDLSGKGHHGSTFGNVQLAADRFGTPNSCYDFDGTDDYINAGNVVTGYSTFTFSFWVNITGYTNVDYMCPLDQGASTYPFTDYPFHFYTGSSTQSAGFQGAWKETPFNFFDLRVNGPIGPASAWHHVLIWYDGTTLKQLVNGSVTKQLSISGKTLGNSYAMLFGKGYAYPNNVLLQTFFKGKIDDIRIYNRALCPDELSLLRVTSQP